MAIVKHVHSYSPFFRRVRKGDDLIKINDKYIKDFLDYMFFSFDLQNDESELEERNISVTVIRKGKELTFSETATEDDLYIEFENDLMDNQKSCHNKCIFCFIDQMPPNMRETLYYKDDDFRLSLIYGNYVTLTNLTDDDIERIIRLRISPLNISVHTTNPELRVKMMANPKAAKIKENLKKFYDAGLNMRCQIVLCKGINDGIELSKTMSDLAELYPYISSVSIVPVGLTKFREGLYPLESFNKEESKAVVEMVNSFGDYCKKQFGTRIFYPSDEFYIKSEIKIPDYDYYENFEQIENGVGMTAMFAREFEDELSVIPENSSYKADITLVTGELIYNFISGISADMEKKFPNIKIKVIPIKNDFFGDKITVTGLITGGDIINQLKNTDIGRYLFVPRTMLKDNNVFLDDITLKQLSKALRVRVINAGSSAEEFIDSVLSVSKNN